MRATLVWATVLALAAGGCSRPSDQRTYPLQGQVVALSADRQQATVKHEEIKGFMPAMTMPYKVKEPQAVGGVKPGDLIHATLVVVSNDAYLTDVRKVGEAPLEAPPPETQVASSGFELLKPGEAVPDAAFVDQNGRTRSFSAYKGQTVVLTFIYTRCPMPTFCPLMDRHFASLQRSLEADPAMKNVQLLSISFDPLSDTPRVLKKHAQELKADPKRWTFFTGDRDAIDQFAARFGVSVSRSLSDALDITHTLRTAIVGPDGKLMKVYTGNEWTPERVLADLKPVASAS
ncbi:MAG: SCO family protein [Acidobacteriota bacterium]